MNAVHQWLTAAGLSAPWLQAYGTLIALGIAIYIPWREHKRVVRREAEQHKAYLLTILAIAERALGDVNYVIENMRSDAVIHHGISTHDLERSQRPLETVTLETLPDSIGFMAIHQIRRELDIIVNIATSQDKTLTAEGVNPEAVDTVVDAKDRATNALKIFSEFVLPHE